MIGVITKEVLEDYFKYRDIKSELLITENDYLKIDSAYIENGMVVIVGIVKPKVTIASTFKVIPDKYAPRCLVGASKSCSSSMNDITKFGYVRANYDGYISLWIYNLDYNEQFTLVYPLKFS